MRGQIEGNVIELGPREEVLAQLTMIETLTGLLTQADLCTLSDMLDVIERWIGSRRAREGTA